MSTNTLIDAVGKNKSSDIDQYKSALKLDHVPRDTNGVAVNEAGSLGTTLLNWKNLYVETIFLDGNPITPAGSVSVRNSIVSGKERTTSTKSDFIRAAGSSDAATIEATTTDLLTNIDGLTVTTDTDIALTSLTTAPATNNTCLVNDATLTGTSGSKYQGEDGTSIIVDTMGSELTSRIGQWVALKHGTSEIMLAFIKSATELTNVFRGFFLDDSGDPIVREVISDGATLTLYELGWVFIQGDSTTAVVSYLSPVWSFTAPGSPATGQYWYDLGNLLWKRWSGSAWIDINRVVLGLVVIDTTNCIASRSFDFAKDYSSFNTIDEMEVESITEIKTSGDKEQLVSVNGLVVNFGYSDIVWDITADLESGFSEAASTWYYLYIDENGQLIMSPERPYNRPEFKGHYHPYNTWRWVGECFNNSGNDLDDAFVEKKGKEYYTTATTLTWNRPVLFNEMNAECLGGGGGPGVSASGGPGGASSFFNISGLGGLGQTGSGQIPVNGNGGGTGPFDLLRQLYNYGGTVTNYDNSGVGSHYLNRSLFENYGQGGHQKDIAVGNHALGVAGCGGYVLKKYSKNNVNFDASYTIGAAGTVGGGGGSGTPTIGTGGFIILNYL